MHKTDGTAYFTMPVIYRSKIFMKLTKVSATLQELYLQSGTILIRFTMSNFTSCYNKLECFAVAINLAETAKFSIKTLRIMMLSITIKNVTLTINEVQHKNTQYQVTLY
jgi:hypothetical protein